MLAGHVSTRSEYTNLEHIPAETDCRGSSFVSSYSWSAGTWHFTHGRVHLFVTDLDTYHDHIHTPWLSAHGNSRSRFALPPEMGNWPRTRAWTGVDTRKRALKTDAIGEKQDAYRHVPFTRTNESKLSHCSLSEFVSAGLTPSPRPPPAPSLPALHIPEASPPTRANPARHSRRNPTWRFRQPVCIVFLAHFSIGHHRSTSFLFPATPSTLVFHRRLIEHRRCARPDVISPVPVAAYSYVSIYRAFLDYRATRITLSFSSSSFRGGSRLSLVISTGSSRERAHLPTRRRFQLG